MKIDNKLQTIKKTLYLIEKNGILKLPKILKTGFKALKTFKAAENFETTFVNTAVEKNINPPFDNKKFNILLIRPFFSRTKNQE